MYENIHVLNIYVNKFSRVPHKNISSKPPSAQCSRFVGVNISVRLVLISHDLSGLSRYARAVQSGLGLLVISLLTLLSR